MKIKSIKSFIRGMFAKEGEESRVDESFLQVAHNVDISPSGRVSRRRGFEAWSDLKDNASVPSSLALPKTDGTTGFGEKIQSMASYTDVLGVRYNVVVSNGKVYIETKNEDDKKIWTCLNPSGNIDLVEKEKHIDIVKFFGSLFFNDVSKDVYVYDTLNYVPGQSATVISEFIYFSGFKIFQRNFDFSQRTDELQVTDSNAAGKWFQVDGDKRFQFDIGGSIIIEGSTLGNDGTYTITALALSAGNTQITVSETVAADSEAAARVTFPSRINIDIETYPGDENFNGSAIYKSLEDIDFLGAGKEITTIADAYFGFSLRTGNSSDGFKYYVLSNGLNQTGSNYCYIIEFNDRFIAQQFVKISIDSTGRVLNFAQKDGFIYIFCQDGVLHRYDPTDAFSDTGWTTKHVANLQAPVHGGKKWYSCTVNSKGIWIYTKKLPNLDDWYQPIYSAIDRDYMSETWFNLNEGVPNYGYSSPFVWAKDLIGSGAAEWFNESFYSYGAGPPPSNSWLFRFCPQASDLQYLSSKLNVVDFKDEIIDDDFNSELHNWCIGGTVWGPDKEKYKTVAELLQNVPGTWEETVSCGDSENTQGLRRAKYDEGQKLIYNRRNNNFFYGLLNNSENPAITTNPWNDRTRIFDLAGGAYPNTYMERSEESTMFLSGTDFNSTFFTDVQNSKMVCMVCIEEYGDDAGDLKKIENVEPVSGGGTETWRYIFPIAEIASLKTVAAGILPILPLQVKLDEIYFGCSTEDGTYTNENNGRYSKLNTITNVMDDEKLTKMEKSLAIGGDERWLIHNQEASIDYFSVEDTFKSGASVRRNDFLNFHDIDTQLIAWANVQVIENAPSVVADQLRHMGTPKAPGVEVVVDASGDFIAGTRLKYHMVFEFLTNKTTMPSLASSEIVIPNSNSSQIVTAVDTGTDTLTVAAHGYSNGQIVRFPEEDSPAPLNFTTNYFIIGATTDTFQVSLTSGGSAVDITGSEINFEVIRVDNQTVGIKLTGLNPINAAGIQIFADASIDKILIYRSQKDFDKSDFSVLLFVAELSKDENGIWYYQPLTPPFDPETYIDNEQALDYFPFNIDNVERYPVNDVVIHKNRLILIARTDLQNPNVIQYSTIEMPEDISAFRDVEAADGDILISGVSVGDFLYLFKREKIYAILGDVSNGQFLDISKTIGCPYKDMTLQYENKVVYFLNDYGIFGLERNNLVNISKDRLDIFFDNDNNDSIAFDLLANKGFVFSDRRNAEIYFFLPKKEDGLNPSGNNMALIYNTEYDFFRTYGYSHLISSRVDTFDVVSGGKMTLISTDAGEIYKINKDKNDAGVSIRWIIRTKDFNLGSDLYKKRYNIIRFFGKYLEDIRITYWLDGTRRDGISNHNGGKQGRVEVNVMVSALGIHNTIMIELNGTDINNIPFEIDEIMIGFSPLRGSTIR